MQQHLEFQLGEDLRPGLRLRQARLTDELERLRGQRDAIDHKITELSERLEAVMDMLEVEAGFWGEQEASPAGANGRFLRMGLRDIVLTLRREQPDITFAEVRDMLRQIGYDFHGRRPGNALNMAWVNAARIIDSRNGEAQG